MCLKSSFKLFESVSSDLTWPTDEKALILMTSDVPSYNLQGLNVNIPEKLSSRILQKCSGQMYCELKQTLTYMLENQDTEFYRNEEGLQA